MLQKVAQRVCEHRIGIVIMFSEQSSLQATVISYCMLLVDNYICLHTYVYKTL
jgi:hypothetical protein